MHINLAIAVIGGAFVMYLIYVIYREMYFNGKEFLKIRNTVQHHVNNCNELNEYIEKLKLFHVQMPDNYGTSSLQDDSRYNFKRPKWAEIHKTNTFVHLCSSSIVKNSSNQPFKYLCKYFNINVDEETLQSFEKTLNDFESVQEGKRALLDERNQIIASISDNIPSLILKFNLELLKQQLGLTYVDLSDLYFPVYSFKYVSPGGNSSIKNDIQFNISNLNNFISYLNDNIKFKKSIAGQRALMTSSLRNKIKNRDNHTCKICNLSTRDERNLLLEIDHIIPLAKGGVTVESNLQTLCWKCNRSKGSKILNNAV
jgi:hypothetical protein